MSEIMSAVTFNASACYYYPSVQLLEAFISYFSSNKWDSKYALQVIVSLPAIKTSK